MSSGGAETGSTQSGQHPQQLAADAVVVAKDLIATGHPETAYRLLHEAMQAAAADGIDTTDIRYWAAQALLAGRHYPQAAQLLGGLAEERPGLDRVRLDYAAVLFTLRRDDEAEAVFRNIRRDEGLLPSVRRRVEQYLERIRARQRLRIDWDFGFWRDDNVNNAPEVEGVEIPLFGGLRFSLDQRPERAWIARTGARLRWRTPVGEREAMFLETHASVARNTALGASEYNRTFATASIGPRIPYAIRLAGRRRPGLFRADVGVERRWQGGDGYTAGVWTGLGVEQNIARNWRVGMFPRVWITRYDEAADGAQPRGALSRSLRRTARRTRLADGTGQGLARNAGMAGSALDIPRSVGSLRDGHRARLERGGSGRFDQDGIRRRGAAVPHAAGRSNAQYRHDRLAPRARVGGVSAGTDAQLVGDFV